MPDNKHKVDTIAVLFPNVNEDYELRSWSKKLMLH